MKILPFVEDLMTEYIKSNYPQEFIVVFSINLTGKYFTKDYQWVYNFCKEKGIDYSEATATGHIILQFDTEAEAIAFCNSVPDSSSYCCVYSHGEVIHENT